MQPPAADEPPVDLELRVPCSDPLCVGVLDEHGVCGTCGVAGALEIDAPAGAADAPGSTLVTAEHTPLDPPAVQRAEASASDDDRVLCSDPLCVGVLDAGGVCGTCGATGVQSAS